MPITLRPYQVKAVQDLRAAYAAGHKAVILRLPTGTGKTVVFGDIAKKISARGNRVLAMVHRQELVDQFCHTLDKCDLSGQYGVIQAGRAPTPWAKFQIGMVQTMVRRPTFFEGWQPDLIEVDECHHIRAASYEKIISWCPDAKILGTTATPCRLDRKPMGKHFSTIVHGPSIEDLVSDGYMAPIWLKYADDGLVMKGVKVQAGDYSRKQQGERVTRKVIVSAVSSFFKYATDRKVIFFAVNVKHSKEVRDEFLSRGIRAAHVDGTTDPQTRSQEIKKFEAGHTQVLCNVDIVSEGTDIENCDCVMVGFRTLSITRWLQAVGRATRPHGRRALIIDLAGNFWIHGHPSVEHPWSLHEKLKPPTRGKAKKRMRAVYRVCKECGTVFKYPRPDCPSCGLDAGPAPPKHIESDLLDDTVNPEASLRDRLKWAKRELKESIRTGTSATQIQNIAAKYGLGKRWAQTTMAILNL